MAPPPNRRSGYSRKAQYSTFFAYLAGAAGALIGAVLLIVSIVSPGAFSWLRSTGNDAASPVASAGASARSGSFDLIETVEGYFAAASKNATMRRELDATKVKLIEAQALAEENQRLKALLKLAESDPKPVAVARLIGSTSASTRRFATLSAGSREGVAVGMPVRSPLGLIGRVLETGYLTSRVLLITDTESVVPVRRASDGVPGFAQGKGDGTVQIRLINLGINPLKPGDAFVTSGSGGLYRPGIPIAVTQTLLRDGAIAQVLSNPAATEYVTVEAVWAPEASASSPAQAAPRP